MNKKIIALIDYKNRFGSKHFEIPFRSGLDKNILATCFKEQGYDIQFVQFSSFANKSSIDKDAYYLYTSSEDASYHYKSFIEDIILYLEEQGCTVIPGYKFLRANNNKVFMELLRKSTHETSLLTIQSDVFGVKEEILNEYMNFKYPVVVKTSGGASGKGVFKADTPSELLKIVEDVSASKSIFHDIKEIARTIKHKGYLKESRFRKKFIVQNMIQGLKNDWKIYFMYDKFYVFYRPIFKHRGFRASGGGYDNYFYDEAAPKPDGLFDFAKFVVSHFPIPHASLDIGWDGEKFHLIEMQFLYFGTAGIPYSKGYYIQKDEKWQFVEEKLSIEKAYTQSVTGFINSII